MSRHEGGRSQKAVALHYGDSSNAPVVVASGMGYMAEKIVETAKEHGVPIYEDNSLATMLTQLQLGQEIPESLYQAIVEIYVYFLQFDPSSRLKDAQKPKEVQSKPQATAASAGPEQNQAQEQQDNKAGEDT